MEGTSQTKQPHRLNANAPSFKPSSSPIAIVPSLPEDPFSLNDNALEMSISPLELEELETVESWVNMMADLEDDEHEHLIAMGLRYADKHKIQEIRKQVLASRQAGARKPKAGPRHG